MEVIDLMSVLRMKALFGSNPVHPKVCNKQASEKPDYIQIISAYHVLTQNTGVVEQQY